MTRSNEAGCTTADVGDEFIRSRRSDEVERAPVTLIGEATMVAEQWRSAANSIAAVSPYQSTYWYLGRADKSQTLRILGRQTSNTAPVKYRYTVPGIRYEHHGAKLYYVDLSISVRVYIYSSNSCKNNAISDTNIEDSSASSVLSLVLK